jgi:hypothetical protein
MVTEKAKISSAAFVGEFRESTCSKAKINRSPKPIHCQLFVGNSINQLRFDLSDPDRQQFVRHSAYGLPNMRRCAGRLTLIIDRLSGALQFASDNAASRKTIYPQNKQLYPPILLAEENRHKSRTACRHRWP